VIAGLILIVRDRLEEQDLVICLKSQVPSQWEIRGAQREVRIDLRTGEHRAWMPARDGSTTPAQL
jgi:hypothetical protein